MVDSMLQGIIYDLTKDCGENVVDAGLISITANRFTSNGQSQVASYDAKDLKYIFEYESNKGYYDDNLDPSWIVFDFKERKISVSKYTIKFGYETRNYVQKWQLQGSNDNDSWTIIDNRESETKKHSNFEIEQYTSNNDQTTQFRYIRLYVKTRCWSEYNVIALTSIEFFGECPPLVPPKELRHFLSFKALDGKLVNDSIGLVWLEGSTFTSLLKRGLYTFSAISYSGYSLIEGIIRLFTSKECEIVAPTTSSVATTVTIGGNVIISAPSSSNTKPIIHSSLMKPNYTENYYSTYKSVLHLPNIANGRVFISFISIPENFGKGNACIKNTIPLSAIAEFAITQ